MLLWPAGIVALLLGPTLAAELLSREYQVKGAYLYKLADYVDWPSAAFSYPASPLTICIVGSDPFGSALDAITGGEHAAGHVITIKRLPSLQEVPDCQVAYITAPTADVLARQLALLAGKPVLTITDGVGDGGTPGIVNFVLRDGRVRFEIDDRSAKDAGLSISSKLLSLAVMVHGRAKEGTP